MNVNPKTLAYRINGMKIIAAPHACTDTVEFMNGARNQFDNTIHAVADMLLRGNPDFDCAQFLKDCENGSSVL